MNNLLLRLAGGVGLLLLIGQTALGAQGIVIQKKEGCNYFITRVDTGYAVLEWNAGHEPKQGDQLKGRFAEGHMGHLEDLRTGNRMKVWFEDFPVSKQDALDRYQTYTGSSCKGL